jgi:hypothetical protein
MEVNSILILLWNIDGGASYMIMLALIGAVVGAVLGLRFKVLILVPAIWLGLLLIIAAGIARGGAAGSIALTCAALATALQFGYLAGTFTRFTIAGSRATRLRWSRPAVNRPPG